jgi:hypothetical protein
MASTDAGIEIDRIGHLANAKEPRVDSFEPVSKVTLARPEQTMKQKSPIVSTDAGMQID